MFHVVKTSGVALSVMMVFLCRAAFVPATMQAATYHLSPNGNDKTGNGSVNAPWQTIAFAQSKMMGGDTLILKDGVYANDRGQSLINPPSGSPAKYTVVKAEHDWKAIIGRLSGGMDNYHAVEIRNRSYVQVEGLKIKNTFEEAVNVVNSSYIKLLRLAIKNGVGHTTTNGNVVCIYGGSHHVLLEDSWISGSMRNGVEVYSRDGGATYKVILRRVVVRWDYFQSDGMPKAAFANLGSKLASVDSTVHDVLCENCMAIDTNPGNKYRAHYGAFINLDHTENIKYLGSLAINTRVTGDDTVSAGFLLNSKESHLTQGNEVINSVAWNTTSSVLILDGDPKGENRVMQSTIGSGSGAAIQNSSRTALVAKNNIFFNNPLANTGVTTADSNWYFPAEQARGTNAKTSKPDFLYILRSPDAQTPDRKLQKGALIEKRYGVSGTLWDEPGFDRLSNENLWPWRFEEQIKADFSESNEPPPGAYPDTNNTKRGFCAENKTLTRYIWEYLGNPCPEEICGKATSTRK